MDGKRRGELVVGFNECEQGVGVWRGIIGVDVALDRARGGLAAVREFLDQVVTEDLVGRCGLNDLLEELSRRFGFFYPRREFLWSRETTGG